MTKVRLLISRAGRDFVDNAGDEIYVSPEEAKRLIESNQAEPISAVKSETATSKRKSAKAIKQ